MNELTKELAKQSLPAFYLTNCPSALEKFAELIVRQCALTAGLMEHEGRKNIGAQILDNFGIENER
jgi:hypothetical protein